MEYPKRGCLPFLLIAAIAAIMVVLLLACGHRSARLLDKTIIARGQITRGQTPVAQDNGGQKLLAPPSGDALDTGLALRHVTAFEDIPLFGADYDETMSGTTCTQADALEVEGDALNLRATEEGTYTWAVFSNSVSEDQDPLELTFTIDVCKIGGGRDDEIPLSYYLGLYDYSDDAWRWFGPYGETDYTLMLNTASLQQRFKSANGVVNWCVLTAGADKAASALHTNGELGALPLAVKTASASQFTPSGVKIMQITPASDTGLITAPAWVQHLTATPSEEGVHLAWEKAPGLNIVEYEICRKDADEVSAGYGETIGVIDAVANPDTLDFWDKDGSTIAPELPPVPGKLYSYTVIAVKQYGQGGENLKGKGDTVPCARIVAAPMSVVASDGTYSDRVALTWTAVEGALSYKIWRAEDVSGTKVMVRQSHDLDVTAWNDYTVAADGSVYYYWIQAIGEDYDGLYSAYETGFAVVLEPVQVTASDGAYPDRVVLLWGMADTADGYHVYRAFNEGDPAPLLIADITGNTTITFDDTLAPWNLPRYYFVRTVVSGVEIVTGAGDWGHRGLAQVDNVAASQGTDALGVNVDWDAVNNATRYAVYRLDAPGVPTGANFIGEVTAPQTDYFDDTTAWSGTEGVHYYYYITARYAGPDTEQSVFSTEAQGWRGIGIPQNVAASDGTLGDRVTISWSSVSQATEYQVFRDGAPVGAPVPAPTTIYSDDTAAFNAHCDYSVKAGITDGYGQESASDEGWCGLLAPANVQASDGTYIDKIVVSWSSVATATGYRIYRSTTDDDTSPPFLASVSGGTTTSYDDLTATPNTQYWYSVAAYMDSQSNEGVRSADDVGTIGNQSPVADLTADVTEGDAPLTVNFDASASYDPDGSIVKYEWDWESDGTWDITDGNSIEEHIYSDAGEYTCTVRVTDDAGATDTASVIVNAYLAEWVHTWGGSEYDTGSGGISVDGNGNIYLTGETDSFGAGSADLILLKYNSGGTILWNKTWGGSGSEIGNGITYDGNGNILVTGVTGSFGAGSSDVILLKYGSSGTLLWQKTWGGDGGDSGQGVIVDGGGNIYVAGTSNSGLGAGYQDIILLKYDSGGSLIWKKIWGGSGYDSACGVTIDGSGDIFLAGTTESFGAGSKDVILLKYDSSGTLLWRKAWGGSEYDNCSGITSVGNDNIYVTGRTDIVFGAGASDVFLLKYNSNGSLLWQKTWGGSADEYSIGSPSVDGNGNIFVTGRTASFGAGAWDLLLLKYSSSGTLLQQKVWGGSNSEDGYGVAVDTSGRVFLTGEALNINGSWQDVNGTVTTPSGTQTSPGGSESAPSGSETNPDGSESTPNGVEDEGGGTYDVLAIKCQP